MKTFASYLADTRTDLSIRSKVLRQAAYIVSTADPVFPGRRLPNAERVKPYSREAVLNQSPIPDVRLPRPSRSSLRSTE